MSPSLMGDRAPSRLAPVIIVLSLAACSSTPGGAKEVHERGWIGGRFSDFVAEDGLGSLIADPAERGRFEERSEAVFIMRVFADTPCARAGLRERDILLRLEGRVLTGLEGLREIVDGCPPGRVLRGQLLRGGALRSFEIEVGLERYTRVRSIGLSLSFSTRFDLIPDPDFNLFSALQLRRCRARVELREPSPERVTGPPKAGVRSQEGFRLRLGPLLFASGIRVLSQVP